MDNSGHKNDDDVHDQNEQNNNGQSEQCSNRNTITEHKDDEEATTSKRIPFDGNPEAKCDNMNDLQAIDINSADTVRQAMKAVLRGKVPPAYSPEFRQARVSPEHRSKFLPVGHYIPTLHLRSEPRTRPYVLKRKQRKVIRKQGALKIRDKRRKQPLSSPKTRKQTVSSMYVGKLSNVVPFRRRRHPDSDSDMDSVILF
ncbi:unnamed protein product [Arctia plantaginis]|uniref:Uncharacterized protein n=1 Tax=Arctia plantaginis TaxID=874455 RepID=A0A8S0YS19_ARCPL|nr:unnamed protein product [Arctia plantaginis]